MTFNIHPKNNRTFDTSKCGSHRTKPRPMMSMAALLKALLAVGVDRKLFEFEPPEAEVGVATALESALFWWLRTELDSIPIKYKYKYN